MPDSLITAFQPVSLLPFCLMEPALAEDSPRGARLSLVQDH